MPLGREKIIGNNFSFTVTSGSKKLPIEANTDCGEKTGTSIRHQS